jgi:ABC-2 type transport system permease protein
MRRFAALLLREEKAIFTSPIAYVVLSVFLVIMGYTFTLTLFVSHSPTLVHLYFQIYVLFLLTVPIITMRLVAEERRLRTLELLLTAPVSDVAVVFAKYFASLSLVVLMLALSGTYAITLGILGQPDWGPIWSGYFGLFLLGGALVAVGLMTSSLVNNQIIAALLSAQPLSAAVDHRPFRLDAARSVRCLCRQPVALGAFHAVCDRLDLSLRRRLLHQRGAARPIS